MQDPSSISRLELEHHGRFVGGLARALLGQEADVQDVRQDTLLTALEKPPRSREPRAIHAYLAQVVRRKVWRRQRSQRVRDGVERDTARPEALPSTEERVAREQALRGVTHAVLALSVTYREVILLRYYEDRTPTEIAAHLKTPLPTVKSRLQRALAQLRGRLDAEHEGDRGAWMGGMASLVRADLPCTPSTANGALMSWLLPMMLVVAAVSLGGFTLLGSRGDAQRRHEHAQLEAEASSTPIAEVALVAPKENGRKPARAIPRERSESGSMTLAARWQTTGLPAAERGYKVMVWGAPAATRERFVRTDGAGSVHLDDLPPGAVTVYGDLGAGGQGTIRSGQETTIDSTFPGGANVRGRVLDPGGQPIVEARLWLSEYGDRQSGHFVGEASADGTFLLENVPVQGYHLGVVARGWLPSPLERLEHARLGEQGELAIEFVLKHGGQEFSVVVEDPAGNPLPGARVALSSAGGGSGFRHGLYWPIDFPSQVGWTGGNGSFFASGLPMTLTVDVLAEGHVRHKQTWGRGSASLCRVRLKAGGEVAGRVTRPSGEPISGVRVTEVREIYDPLMPMSFTDSEGRYRIGGLPTGPIALLALERGVGRDDGTVEITSGAAATWNAVIDNGRPVDIPQQREEAARPGGIRIRCTDMRGDPVAGFLAVQPLGNRRGRHEPLQEDGTLTISDLPPWRYAVELHTHAGTGRSLGEHQLSADEVLDLGTIQLEDPGSLRFEVGEGDFENASILQYDPETGSAWSAISLGYLELQGGEAVSLLPGRYDVHFGGGDFATTVVPTEVRAGEDTVVRAPEPQPGRRLLLVLHTEGEPEYLRLQVHDSEGTRYEASVRSPDSEGTTELYLTLAAGPYLLRSVLPDGGERHYSIEVPEPLPGDRGERLEIPIELD